MNAEIQIEGEWHPCQFSFPYTAPPIAQTMPGGAIHMSTSPYTRFNARLIMPLRGPLVGPGTYYVRADSRTIEFVADKPEGEVIWGNVL